MRHYWSVDIMGDHTWPVPQEITGNTWSRILLARCKAKSAFLETDVSVQHCALVVVHDTTGLDWRWPSWCEKHTHTHTHPHTHIHTRLTALCPGLPGWAGTRKAKPIWILLKQETVSGNGISWAICKSAPHSRQITTPAPHTTQFFTDQMPFLPPNQQCQSTEGKSTEGNFLLDVKPTV